MPGDGLEQGLYGQRRLREGTVDRMAEELSGRGERATELLYRAVHEDFYGPHYNKDLAETAVEKMFHKSASGELSMVDVGA